MIITLVGDMHITDRRPSCRNDPSYHHSCIDKFNQILNYSSDVILQAGDFFDHYRVSNSLLGDVILLARLSRKEIYCVFGQHDMKFHSDDFKDTALRVMCDTGNVHSCLSNIKIDDINITLVNFGKPIPKPKNKGFNILVIHKMITKDGPLFPGHSDFITAKNFLKMHDYDLVLSGDNHKCFTEIYGKKTLINPGTMVRKTTTDKEHKPCFFTLDTKTLDIKQHFLKVEPDPFIEIGEKVVNNEQINFFIENLKTKVKLEGIDFVDNLYTLSNNEQEEVKTFLRRSLEHGD